MANFDTKQSPRHSRVDPNTNQYIKPKSKALVYSTMTWVRSMIVSIPECPRSDM